MFELFLSLALGEVAGEIRQSAAVSVGVYQTWEACDAARWEWFARETIPPGYSAPWHQFMPGTCEPVQSAPLVG